MRTTFPHIETTRTRKRNEATEQEIARANHNSSQDEPTKRFRAIHESQLVGYALTIEMTAAAHFISSTDVWSWVIFQPSGNLRRMSVNRPRAVFFLSSFSFSKTNSNLPRIIAALGLRLSTCNSL